MPTSPILQAAYVHDWDLVADLHESTGSLTVHEAAAVGDIDVVAGLVDADPTLLGRVAADGFTPLHLAAYFGRVEVAIWLVDAGADVDAVSDNPNRLRPLHAAVAARNAAIVTLLLDGGAEPDARQAGGFTALMAAAKHGDVEIIRALVTSCADPTVLSDDGLTAGDMAADDLTAEVKQLL